MKKLSIKYLFLLFIFIGCNSQIDLNPLDSSSGGDNSSRSRNNEPSIIVNNYEKEIFELVNKHRESLGKNKLIWHDQAIIEAQDHSIDMANLKVPFGHTGSSARFQRIKDSDPDSIIKLGENVSKNSNAQKAFDGWLLSYGHRKNIESDYTHTGIGAEKSSNGYWYFTQIFLKK